MWAIARPTLLKNVAPDSRTSGRNPDAENLRRSAMVGTARERGEDRRVQGVAVEERHGGVQDVVGGERHTGGGRAARPWVIRTALGARSSPT